MWNLFYNFAACKKRKLKKWQKQIEEVLVA